MREVHEVSIGRERRALPGRLARLAALAVVLTASACGATRAYQGPEQPDEALAHIHDYPRLVDTLGEVGTQLTGGSTWYTSLLGVDDGEELSKFGSGDADVLPGRHAVRARLMEQNMAGSEWYDARLALFDTQAGHDYQLRGHGPSLAEPMGFEVWDVQADTAIASSHPRGEDCMTARVDWAGARWTETDWDRTADVVTSVWMPTGQTSSAWSELVKQRYHRAWQPIDLDVLMKTRLDHLESSSDEAFQVPLESAAGLRVFTWSAESGDKDFIQGVTCLRAGPRGCHELEYVVHGVLQAPVAATWAARLKAAELLPPSY
jgi:hypothetical protein